jgi:hypothetical protein
LGIDLELKEMPDEALPLLLLPLFPKGYITSLGVQMAWVNPLVIRVQKILFSYLSALF